MATPTIAATPTDDDVLEKEKSMPDVVDTELDKVICEEEVAAMVVVLETKTGELGDINDAKGGKGVIEFLDKNRSSSWMEDNKREPVVNAKDVVATRNETKMEITKVTHEDGMAEGTTYNFEVEATKLVVGGKAGKLLLASLDKKTQMEVAGMEDIKDSEPVEWLDQGEQHVKGRQSVHSKNKHDKNMRLVTKEESIEASMTRDNNDVVIEGKDDGYIEHVMEPTIKHPHLVTPEILEDVTALALGGEAKKHGGIEPKIEEVVVAVAGKMNTSLQALEKNEFVMEEVSLPLAAINMEATVENFEPIGATTEVSNNELIIMSDMRLSHQFGEVCATLTEQHSARYIPVEGGFCKGGLENQVVESSNKYSCCDSSNMIEEEEIKLDLENKNYDSQEMKYKEVVIAEEGELIMNLPATSEYENVKDSPLVHLDATLVIVKGTCATQDKIDSRVAIVVDDVTCEDQPTIVEDKSTREYKPIDPNFVQESEVKQSSDHKLEKDFHQAAMQINTIFSQQALDMKSQVSPEGDLLDAHASIISRHAQNYFVEVASSEVVKTESTFEIKDISTLTQASNEITQDMLAVSMMEPSMDHPYSSNQDVLVEKTTITLAMDDIKNDEVAGTAENEPQVYLEETIEVESVIEDRNTLVNLDGTQEEVTLPLADTIMEATLAKVEQIGAIPKVSNNELTIMSDMRFSHQFGEVGATLIEQHSATDITIEGGFYEDTLENQVAKSSNKYSCCDSSNMIEEEKIMLDSEDKNNDNQDIKYNEVVIAKEGELTMNLPATYKYKTAEDLVHRDTTLVIMEGTCATQDDSQEVIIVDDVTCQDQPTIVEDKSIREYKPIDQNFVKDSEVKQSSNHELKKYAHQVATQIDTIFSQQELDVKSQTSLEGDKLDTHASVISSHAKNYLVEAASSKVVETESTFEIKHMSTLTQAGNKISQDVLALHMVEPSIDHPYSLNQDVLEEKTLITSAIEDIKNIEVAVKIGNELQLHLEEAIDGENVIEDGNTLVSLNGTQGEVEETGTTLEENKNETTTLFHIRLDQMDDVHGKIAKIGGEFHQATSIDFSEVPNERKVIFGQDDKNYDVNEVSLVNDLPDAPNSKFASIDTISLDASDVQCESTLCEVEELSAIMGQEDGLLPTTVDRFIKHDEPTIVKETSVKQSISLEESASRLDLVEEVEKYSPQIEKDNEEKELVKSLDLQDIPMKHLFDKDPYFIYSNTQTIMLGATLRYLDKIGNTSEAKNSETLTQPSEEIIRDVPVRSMVQPNKEHSQYTSLDDVNNEAPITLVGDDVIEDSIEPKFSELRVKGTSEFSRDMHVTLEGEFVLEDTTSLSIHSQGIHLGNKEREVKEKRYALHTTDSEITTTVHKELDHMDDVDATNTTLQSTSNKIQEKYCQVAYVDSELLEEAKVVSRQDDNNNDANEVMPIVQGELEKVEVVEQSRRETDIEGEFAKSEVITDEVPVVSETIQQFVYDSGHGIEDVHSSNSPRKDVNQNNMEKMPSLRVDEVPDGYFEEGQCYTEVITYETQNDVVGENFSNIRSTYANFSDDVLAHELALVHATDDDTKHDKNVVEEVVESDKEQSLSSAIMKEWDTVNDEIVMIPNNDKIYDTIIDDGSSDDEINTGLSFSTFTSRVKPTKTTSAAKDVIAISEDGSKMFSMDSLTGFDLLAPPMRQNAPLPPSDSCSGSVDLEAITDPTKVMTDDEKKMHEKLEMIRVKFLRFVCRMGGTTKQEVVAQVLNRLSLAEAIHDGGHTNEHSTLENDMHKALQQEAKSQEELSFSCNILVLGKSGVGKSATINSIFGEEKSKSDAFGAGTTDVREIYGTVDGIQLHIIDTPGLSSNVIEQGWNKKILSTVNMYAKKFPPDIILYVDRLDNWCRDYDDLPLLRTITTTLGTSIWFNTIVALTHATSAPPDRSSGDPMTYEEVIAHKSQIIQQSIRQAATNIHLKNPVALVENHPSCHRNSEGQKVLPNGQAWRNQLMLLCYSTKTMAEANFILKLQDTSPRRHHGSHLHQMPLPFFLCSLLQRISHPKVSSDQDGTEDDSDVDVDVDVDCYPKIDMPGENDHGSCPKNVVFPLFDMVLQLSFDSDDPTHRYYYPKMISNVIARPLSDMHGWDHDNGFDRVGLESDLAIIRKFPRAVSVQFTKDKNNFIIHLDSSIARKHGENASSLAAFYIQTVRKHVACAHKDETKFKNIKNNIMRGFLLTFLGDTMATGVKVEDKISIGKCLSLAASIGAMRGQGDTAYVANLETCLKNKHYPINKFMLFLGLSLMRWCGNDISLEANMHTQFSVGSGSKMAFHIGINNKLSGHINVRMSTSEQVQTALLGLVPIVAHLYKGLCPPKAQLHIRLEGRT